MRHMVCLAHDGEDDRYSALESHPTEHDFVVAFVLLERLHTKEDR